MTEALFRDDAYLATCEATITRITEAGGIVLDRTIFYATGGGQPGDIGEFETADGMVIAIANTVHGETPGEIVHVPAEGTALPAVGTTVQCRLDWPRRHRLMRMHTAMHLLSAVLPYPVTGGSVGEAEGRLDFDIPEAGLDKDEITAKLNALVEGSHKVSSRWITDAELDADPGLVKTMSVQPPRGSGHVRLIEIEGQDLQPCGGTHVKSTEEIGPLVVAKIEKKGRQNRRVRLRFADDGSGA